MTRSSFPACLSLLFLVALFHSQSLFAANKEIVYDNTSTPLFDTRADPPRQRYANQKVEYGDQLQLGGTGRYVTDIYFEYFGNFTAQGDEMGWVRIYNNRLIYDQYRNSPTDVLYESGFFPVYPGYHVEHLENLNVRVPDIITLGLSFTGLDGNEDAGFLLYSPPTVGLSYNEFWRRTPANQWEAFTYTLTDPTLKANASIRIMAVTELLEMHAQIVNSTLQLTWTGPGESFEVQRSLDPAGPYEQIGTTTQRAWTEPLSESRNFFYRIKQL
jgi:hypothetical protein